MSAFPLSKAPIIHVGSTKNLRHRKKATAKTPGVLWFEFTDDYSVFDYGKMPDAIPNKGAAAAMMSAHLFEQVSRPATWKAFRKEGGPDAIRNPALRREIADSKVLKELARSGLSTHYRGILNEKGEAVSIRKLKKPSNILEVAAVRILPPEPVVIGGRRLYHYGGIRPDMTNFLVPLECVFRFGVPRGSSLIERLAEQPDYARELGLKGPVKEGSVLSRPVIEFSSKLEPADRFLSYEFAMNVAGLSGERFAALIHTTLLVALWLRERFAKTGIKLWDGKFEFLRLGNGLALGDAITPDELRLTFRSLQISKEPLRQYHKRHQPGFIEAMKEAKRIALSVDRPLSRIVADLGHPPKPLDPRMLDAVSQMYAGITERLLGREVFGGTPSLETVSKQLSKLGVA